MTAMMGRSPTVAGACVLEGSNDPVEVMAGTLDSGLRWVVTVQGDENELFTMLHVYDGDRRLAGSAFGGPPLYDGSLMNEYRGRTDDLPWFVMARTAPVVDRVIATTDGGTEITLELSPPIDRFGLRFAVAALPTGQEPGSIRAEQGGTVLETIRQWVPPRRFFVMHELLSAALLPVFTDLRSTGAPVPEIAYEDWMADPTQASAMLRSPDGSATGLRMSLAGTESDRIAEVADQVQEWAIEELWGDANTNWPQCPQHPNSHPLSPLSDQRVASWVCPENGAPVCAIGSLT